MPKVWFLTRTPTAPGSHFGKRMSRGSIPPPRPCSRSQLARLAPIFPRLAFRSSTPRDSSSSSWLDEGFDECNRWRSRLASSRRFPSNGEPRTSGVSFALARLGGSWGRGGDAPKGGSRGPTKFRMCNQGYGVGQKYGDFRFPDGYDLGSICGQIQTWVAHRSLPGSKEDDTAFWIRLGTSQKTTFNLNQIYLNFAARSGWREATRQTSTFWSSLTRTVALLAMGWSHHSWWNPSWTQDATRCGTPNKEKWITS